MELSAGGDYIREGSDRNSQYWWAFIIFAIFAFIWAKRDRREDDDGVLKYAVAGNMMNKKPEECERIWDVERDMMNQFAQTRMEAQQNKYDLTRDSDRYFYEQQKTSLVGFKDVEIQGLQNTSKIESRIDRMEQNWRDAEDRKKESRINYLETLVGIRGLGLIPSNPYAQVPYPYQNCNPCAQYA